MVHFISTTRTWTLVTGLVCLMSLELATAVDLSRSGDLNCNELCELGQGHIKSCACAETLAQYGGLDSLEGDALGDLLDNNRGLYPSVADKRQAPKNGIFRWGKRGDTPVFRWGKRSESEESLADNYKRLFRWGKRDSKTPVFRWGKRALEFGDDELDSYIPRSVRGTIFRWGKRDPNQAVFRWGRSTRRQEDKANQDTASRTKRTAQSVL